jgi:O-methyltransferase
MLRNLFKSALNAGPRTDAAALYLDLLKACLTNSIYGDDLDLRTGVNQLDAASGKIVSVKAAAADSDAAFRGGIWPSRAHTMIGLPRLDNLQYCIEDVIGHQVPGDLIETGVWRGGACIFMRAVLKIHDVRDRAVWVADSFEGLPEADAAKHPYDRRLNLHQAAALAVSLEEVRENFARYGLLDEQVHFLKGWFSDTLPSAPIERLAILRLDGDHYESTMDALNALYAKLSVGGYVIVDDYGVVEGCNLAIADFRRRHAITDDINAIAGGGAFWRRGSR